MGSQEREVVTGDRPWPERYTYAPALRLGDTVFISGTTATDDAGHLVGAGDIVEQTRQVFRTFERLLNAVGGSCADIVQTVDYVTTTENYKATAAVRREFLKDAKPASTGVIVAGLLREGALIEISAVAVLRR
jgi:enamine deaminase RidA (YjgF/YER057c/UK114 family)